jgi:sugar phosphate isomerase/epimerase
MDRRELLRLGAATMAASALPKTAIAQGAPARFEKLRIDCYTRHLLWLRKAGEVAAAINEMGYDGVDIAVRPGLMGHVEPERVATELPPFVAAMRGAGLTVRMITCPILDADSPFAESILDTASKLGIHHYWWGTFQYEQDKPLRPQMEALKPRVAKLARLNEKYGMKAMYHTYSTARNVGSSIWDLLEILRENDPRWVSFHYDTGHSVEGGGINTWTLGFRAAGPYIGGLAVKDSRIELNTQPPPPQNGAAPAGRGGGQQIIGTGPGPEPLPWRNVNVPLGEGYLNFRLLTQVMKEIQFNGPVEIQSEYPNGGANNAQTTLTLPRAEVLGNMKKDLLVLRSALEPAGFL